VPYEIDAGLDLRRRAGFLLGCAICLIQDIAVLDSLFRVFVLTIAGAWMGVLLGWLDQLLPAAKHQQDDDTAKQDARS